MAGDLPASMAMALGPDDARRSSSSGAAQSWGFRYARRLAVTDWLAVLWAAVGAHVVHIGELNSRLSRHPLRPGFLALTVGLCALWLLAVQVSGSRHPRLAGQGPTEYTRVMQATFAVFGVAAICSFVFDLALPRAYLLIMMPAGLAALVAGRFGWRRWLHRMRSSGAMMTKVLAVGDARAVNDLTQNLARSPLCGYTVVAACVPAGTSTADVPVAGDLSEITEAARRVGADAIAVTASSAFGSTAVRRLGWQIESSDTELMLAPALTNIAGPRVHTQPVAGLPLIHVDRPTYHQANHMLKRTFDMVGAAVLLVVLLPVLLATAIAVKLSGPGPVFFRQQRAGLHGKRFNMIKFRSMVTDAEARLSELTQQRRDAGNDVMFKIKNDPRVTGVGRVLRRYSIDELPQLLNVIRGSMSLVGPRPPLVSEVELYGDDARRRLLVKPGMTGLWQVSGRSDLTWDDTVRLDVYYVENWSLTADLVILWKTVKAVFSSSGAY
ncbi:MAG TPA: sugar transferase [Nakamurella sp.]|nr:sugar transferase [Nakamurella sp.]